MQTRYQPQDIESKWRTQWESQANYESPAGRDSSYCLMLPPPNVTGSLHMGHAFSQTLMDILVRYNRMQGHDTLWQGGCDHAGIATQMMVERQLQTKGISRTEIGRENFLSAVWDWKNKSGDRISQQMRRLGATVNWSEQRFTMDPDMSSATRHAFVRLHKDGLIYQGNRLVNWDPVLKTALSDLEVESRTVQGSLWHIRYPVVGTDEYLLVATTRPETLLGDTGVAVHPEDERYASLIGRKVLVPFCGREIPIVADDAVDREFGTGCVKITPAHDFTDYEIGTRHDLELITILTPDGHLNELTPLPFRGLSVSDARKLIVKELDTLGLLVDTEKHEHAVPHGDRSGAILEPRLTKQWYLRMQTLAEPAIEAAKTGALRFMPDNWKKTYLQWLENIQDWCLSRQLWWGHRIPVWYDTDGNAYVGESEEAIRASNNLSEGLVLKQDEDVLDTWFSSSLWPFATLGWPEKTPRFDTYFPTQTLVTGFDIIFFWVARMVMMSMYFTGKVPFSEVYIHGLIRDSNGQKMSKTKGNVIDPIDVIDGIGYEELLEKRTAMLINPKLKNSVMQATKKQFPKGIEAYGTDAMRFTFAALASTGRDINFDFSRVEGYRNFCNKLWNAARYIEMNTGDLDHAASPNPATYTLADKWILTLLSETITTAHQSIKEYRFDLLASALYEFTWNNFCDWYLEVSKGQLAGEHKEQTQLILTTVLKAILSLLHPITPFITEEIWASVVKSEQRLLINEPYPASEDFTADAAAKKEFVGIQALITSVRRLRSEIGVSPAKKTKAYLKLTSNAEKDSLIAQMPMIKQLAKIDCVEWVSSTDSLPATATAQSAQAEVFIPLQGLINKSIELTRLQQQIKKLTREQLTINKRLQNKRYCEQAPQEVVAKEKEKLSTIDQTIERLTNHHATITDLQE